MLPCVDGGACVFNSKHPTLKGVRWEMSVQLTEKYSLKGDGIIHTFNLPAGFRMNSLVAPGPTLCTQDSTGQGRWPRPSEVLGHHRKGAPGEGGSSSQPRRTQQMKQVDVGRRERPGYCSQARALAPCFLSASAEPPPMTPPGRRRVPKPERV